ncbi:MAG: caa(3)-type oxidase, subunit [Planctomycetaceae bacterium]|nr:caa(3)-type oxidase, subunit [Planctomycetaceae bacterium]
MSQIKTKVPSLTLNIAVYAALLFLLAVTVWASRTDLGYWNFVAAAGIASLKASLIVLFFMRVYYAKPLIWLASGAGFVWLAILFNLVVSDYLTRSRVQSAPVHETAVYEVPDR